MPVVAVADEVVPPLAVRVLLLGLGPELLDAEADVLVEVSVLVFEIAEANALESNESRRRILLVTFVPLIRIARIRGDGVATREEQISVMLKALGDEPHTIVWHRRILSDDPDSRSSSYWSISWKLSNLWITSKPWKFSISIGSVSLMSRMDEHYIRVRVFAERFDLSESAVYKKIERGEIKAIRIGKTVRIPSSELERYLNPVRILEEAGAPRDGEPHNLGDSVARFEEHAGHSPVEFVEAWRSGKIQDTPENARLAIEALALREALQQPSTV